MNQNTTYDSRTFGDGYLFGNGEKLMRNGVCVTTVKKRMPRSMELEDDNNKHYLH